MSVENDGEGMTETEPVFSVPQLAPIVHIEWLLLGSAL